MQPSLFHTDLEGASSLQPVVVAHGLEPRVCPREAGSGGVGGAFPAVENSRNNVLTLNQAGAKLPVSKENSQTRPSGTRNLEKEETQNEIPQRPRSTRCQSERNLDARLDWRSPHRRSCANRDQRNPNGTCCDRQKVRRARRKRNARCAQFQRTDTERSSLHAGKCRSLKISGVARRCQTASGRIPKFSSGSLDAGSLPTCAPRRAKLSPLGCSASATMQRATASSSLVRWAAGAGRGADETGESSNGALRYNYDSATE